VITTSQWDFPKYLRCARGNAGAAGQVFWTEAERRHHDYPARQQQRTGGASGTVHELVSRNLGRLQSENFIQMEGRTVTIVDLQELEAELNTAQ
jgi:hypothetical protein